MADIKFQVDVDTRGGVNNLKQLQDQVGKTGGLFGGLQKLVVATGAAIGTGVLVSSIKNAMNSVDGLAKSARALGVSAANFQALTRSAALAGIGLGELQAVATRLQTNLINAVQRGVGPAAQGIDRLGLSARELANQPLDQQLQNITAALRNIQNPAERTALAVELLGRQGPRMLEVADNMNRLREQMENAGLALTGFDTTAIEAANDAVSELGFVFDSIRQKIASDIAPFLIVIANRIKDAVLEGGGLANVFTTKVIPAIKLTAQTFAILISVIVAGKIAAIIAAATSALITMITAIRGATTAMALFNAVASKNPLIFLGTAVLSVVAAGAALFKINDAFSAMDDEVKKIVEDLEAKNAELEKTQELAGDLTLEFANQKNQIQDTIRSYRQGNEDFVKRFELQTKLTNKTEEERLEIETLAQVEQQRLRAVTALMKEYQEATADRRSEIRAAVSEVNQLFEQQEQTVRGLINQRLEQLSIQKEQVELEKQLVEATKRREVAEDSVRKIMIDGMDNVRRAMERAELDGLGGIARALREIEIEERRVAEAARRRVAEQFGDNDPAGLMKALDDIDRATQAVIERRKEATQAIITEQRTFADGWKKAFNEFRDNATNSARQAQRIFSTMSRGMEDSIVNFAKTGKFQFRDFANTVLEELLRIQIQRTFANLLSGGRGGSGSSSLFAGFFATGGMIPPGRFGVVGESGPELVQGPADITPIAGTQVTYNINAVDAMSFKQLLAQDPSFLFGVSEQGRRRAPGTRR